MHSGVKEHGADYFSQDSFCCTGDTCIVKQVAVPVFRLHKELVGQPTNQWMLSKAGFGL